MKKLPLCVGFTAGAALTGVLLRPFAPSYVIQGNFDLVFVWLPVALFIVLFICWCLYLSVNYLRGRPIDMRPLLSGFMGGILIWMLPILIVSLH